MMQSPLVSVVIPVYNAEKYIEQTIRSVLNQTFHDFEIIVLNDGSTDASGEIIQRLQNEDGRIIYVPKKNSGVSDTRNTGILKARGKYISFLDADDLWERENLQKKIFRLKETGKKWVFSNIGLIDEFNRPIGVQHHLAPKKDIQLFTENMLDRLLLWEDVDVIPAATSNLLVELDLLGDDVRFDCKLSSPADRDVCIQLSAKAEPALVDEKLILYRFHAQNMTSTNRKVANEVVYFIEKVKKANLFSSRKIRRQSLSNLNLMLSGIYYRFLGEKIKAIKYFCKSFVWSPGNIWKKKIAPIFRFSKNKSL